MLHMKGLFFILLILIYSQIAIYTLLHFLYSPFNFGLLYGRHEHLFSTWIDSLSLKLKRGRTVLRLIQLGGDRSRSLDGVPGTIYQEQLLIQL